MMRISISEVCLMNNGTYQAELRFDKGPTYPIVINDPFSSKEEESLEWYFEKHLQFPFLEEVKFKTVATSIFHYGENLFEQVFNNNHQVRQSYQDAVQENEIEIEIVGSPEFHHFHWEAMKVPGDTKPLALSYTIIRKVLGSSSLHTIAIHKSSLTINVLLIVARPNGQSDVGYRTISRPLVEIVQHSDLPVKIDIVRPGTYKKLREHLEKYGKGYYHLIHFDVHGELMTYPEFWQGSYARYDQADQLSYFDGYKAFLLFLSHQERLPHAIEANRLAKLLTKYEIPIAILNACQSAKQLNQATETSLASRLQQAGIQAVLAMAYSVTVTAATKFMGTLYQQLFNQPVWSEAIQRARLELYNDKTRRAYFNQQIDLEDWLLPVVYQQRAVTLPLRAFTVAKETAATRRYVAPVTHYGFVGRDLDVLEIEQRLLSQGNELLIQGLGGVGKTTLLHHLGVWWQTTRLVEQVFYFGYDERAWHSQQILDGIARQLYGETTEEYLQRFQALSMAAQQAKLVQKLRTEQHLLILDNLESITGTRLAILHTLSPAEQSALHGFLVALQSGKTLVLLGSRSEEAWLARGTFEANVYVLSGLDPEARTELANKILNRYQISNYWQDADFQQLLKLLAGYPLAMEVVLRNLARQSPTEVLQALAAGEAKIDFASANKTESLLRCIEYSHSNLSVDAQELLGCLAPFTGVVGTYQITLEGNNVPIYAVYLQKLQQQPLLAHLPFNQWEKVLKEAIHWGLLKPHPDFPVFLIQPIFPYFLRHRLQTTPVEYQQAIHTAFREYYDWIGWELRKLLNSKQPNEKLGGQVLAELEYENLHNALELALTAQVSTVNPRVALSDYLEMKRDYLRGLALGEEVRKKLQQYPTEKLQGSLGAELVGVLDNIASCHLSLQQYFQAEQTYQEAFSLHQKLTIFGEQDKNLKGAGIYLRLGRVAQEQRRWEQVQNYYQQALHIYKNFQDSSGQARTYHQLGSMAQEQRQWGPAKDEYQKALTIYKSLQDPDGQARIYLNLGYMAQEQRQWGDAQKEYQEALKIYESFQDHYGQARTHHNLGYIAQAQQQWKQAQEEYQKALALFIESSDRYSLSRTYHQLGIVAQEQQEWEQAREYYQKSLGMKKQIGDRYGQASTYHQLGILAAEQEQWPEAKDYLLTALWRFVEFKDAHNGGITLFGLDRLYEKTQDEMVLIAVGEVLGVKEEMRKIFKSFRESEQDSFILTFWKKFYGLILKIFKFS